MDHGVEAVRTGRLTHMMFCVLGTKKQDDVRRTCGLVRFLNSGTSSVVLKAVAAEIELRVSGRLQRVGRLLGRVVDKSCGPSGEPFLC